MASSEEKRRKALDIALQRAAALRSGLDGGIHVAAPNGWPAALVCGYFSTRTARLLSAAVDLCRNSYGIESQSLLRSMVQDMVDVRYIATDPEPLAKQWCEHESRRRYYIYTTRKTQQEMDEPHDFAELERLIERDWQEAKGLTAARLHKDVRNVTRNEARSYLLKNRWTRLSIAQAAEAAAKKYPDTGGLFEWYAYLSDHAHGSPALARDYIEQRDTQTYIKDHRDPRFKSASMAVSALVYAHATFVGLRDIGLDYDPSNLIEDVPFEDGEFDDL